MHLSALRKPKHRRQLRIGDTLLLIIHEGPDDIWIDGTSPIIHKRHAAIQLVEREAGLHPEPISAVRFLDLCPEHVGTTVDRLGYAFVVVQQPERHVGGFVPGVPEAHVAAGDYVEFVVGQFEGPVDADRYRNGAFFGFLKKKEGISNLLLFKLFQNCVSKVVIK